MLFLVVEIRDPITFCSEISVSRYSEGALCHMDVSGHR